ncbi:ubiquitin fusion degradation protein, variant 2 [Basidiobolus ranarum]
MLPGNERENVNFGGKIILPQSALARLASLNIAYPMLFSLENELHNRHTHAGVLEFIAEEGRVYLPHWIMQSLLLEPGDLIEVKNVTLPLGSFVKIQPQSVDFLDITDPKAVLENALRNFTTLTNGDIITIHYNNHLYEILVMEVKPTGPGISIVETDLEVDFAPPVGYVEPVKPAQTPTSSMAKSLGIDEIVKEVPNKWSAFQGNGSRLSGKGFNTTSTNSETTLKKEFPSEAPLDLPFGKLFFGYTLVPLKVNVDLNDTKENKFVGGGKRLRTRKKKATSSSVASTTSSP